MARVQGVFVDTHVLGNGGVVGDRGSGYGRKVPLGQHSGYTGPNLLPTWIGTGW